MRNCWKHLDIWLSHGRDQWENKHQWNLRNKGRRAQIYAEILKYAFLGHCQFLSWIRNHINGIPHACMCVHCFILAFHGKISNICILINPNAMDILITYYLESKFYWLEFWNEDCEKSITIPNDFLRRFILFINSWSSSLRAPQRRVERKKKYQKLHKQAEEDTLV